MKLFHGYPKLHYTINSEWADTGPIASLLEPKFRKILDVSFPMGIFYFEKTVKEL